MLEGKGFTVEPLRYSRGDHLVLRVTKDGKSGQLTIGGSPRGPVLDVIHSIAKRALRQADVHS